MISSKLEFAGGEVALSREVAPSGSYGRWAPSRDGDVSKAPKKKSRSHLSQPVLA